MTFLVSSRLALLLRRRLLLDYDHDFDCARRPAQRRRLRAEAVHALQGQGGGGEPARQGRIRHGD